MDTNSFIGLAGVPLIVALVQVAKAWVKDERYYPLASLALGLAINLGLALAREGDLPTAILVGLIAGLAASGLYSQAKTMA